MKTTKLLCMVASISALAWLTGCESTPESRIRDNPAAFAQLTPQEQTLVRSGQLGVGFSSLAVKLALGDPTSVTLRTDAQGQVQVWHYSETVYYDGTYIYGGPYWGGWGGGWGRRGGWGVGGYWGPGIYPVGPVSTYDSFRVEFRNDRVVSFSQEVR